MVDDSARRSAVGEPAAVLSELIERLRGTWRVGGPDIEGQAEYTSANAGRMLVASVDFVISGTRMRLIQHITYDEDAGALRARYMDTMGDESIYTWTLDGRTLRVSLGTGDSDTYFEAVFNDDDSEYAGSWQYPDGIGSTSDEQIVYTRTGTDRMGTFVR